jgi:glycosyltransferase involved in cell wall biosynthesis
VIGYPGPRNLPGVEFIDRQMSRDEISALYGGALGFVFPSVSEGFGMPILEAMASGCPVVTSQGTACGEVAGDAALLVDPYSVPAIAQAMQTLWQDRSARTRLRASGRAHALGFDWDASARLHAQVFRQAAGG